MVLQRRSMLLGIAATLATPAIVRAASIMPVKRKLVVLDNKFNSGLYLQSLSRACRPALIRNDIFFAEYNLQVVKALGIPEKMLNPPKFFDYNKKL